MIILAAEIPAACAAACEVTGEPWQHHPSAICLRAIPRLHHRLTALGIPAAATDLETGMHHWTRLVKLALGLRTPDIPPARTKPLITGPAARGRMPSARELASSKLSPIRRPAPAPWRRTGPQRTAGARPRRRVPRRRTRSPIVRSFHGAVARIGADWHAGSRWILI
jgi:hypothetical protein